MPLNEKVFDDQIRFVIKSELKARLYREAGRRHMSAADLLRLFIEEGLGLVKTEDLAKYAIRPTYAAELAITQSVRNREPHIETSSRCTAVRSRRARGPVPLPGANEGSATSGEAISDSELTGSAERIGCRRCPRVR